MCQLVLTSLHKICTHTTPRALTKMIIRSILEALDRVGDYELQNAVRQLVQLIEPSARFCAYQLERQGAAVPSDDALAALGDQDATVTLAALQVGKQGARHVWCQLLHARHTATVPLVAAPAQAGLKGAKLAPTSSSAPAATASVTWRGTIYPAYRDNVLERVQAASQARAALDACMDSEDAVDARVVCYDALIRAYHHLVIVIHKELQSATRTRWFWSALYHSLLVFSCALVFA